MWLKKLALIILILLPFAQANSEVGTLKIDKVMVLTVNSTINPATLNYLKTGMERAQTKGQDLVVVEINTPGGLVTTTKDILTLFGESDIPVVVWVKPEGASATSAGAIIASGAHLLFMADGTNIGAATPVQAGKDIESEDLRKKAINDLVALVKSLSESKGRNPKLFGDMIEKATSFKAGEAKIKNLADEIVNSRREFQEKLQGKKVKIKGVTYTLDVGSLEWTEVEMDQGQQLLNIFANPSLAYILFLIGAALIYLELQAPGGLVAGSVGAICLVLAGIGFQVLPLNLGALGLILLSFILFTIEIYVTSYGILSLAGILSLIFGSMFLYRTEDSYLTLSTSLIVSAVAGIGAFILFLGWYIARDHHNIGSGSFNEHVGKLAKVIEQIDSDEAGKFAYSVKVGGEFWKAVSDKELSVDEHYEIKEHDSENMMLIL